VKAITICQPYAHLVIHGPKPGSELGSWGRKVFENRTWRSDYRGPLAIHAGLSRAWLDLAMLARWGIALDELRFGYLLGVVQMDGSVPASSASGPWVREGNGHCHRYTRVLHVLEKPIQWRGAQQFFDVPDDVLGPGVFGHAGGGAGGGGADLALKPQPTQGGLFR
jgi:activating signal cointegrator 1